LSKHRADDLSAGAPIAEQRHQIRAEAAQQDDHESDLDDEEQTAQPSAAAQSGKGRVPFHQCHDVDAPRATANRSAVAR